MYTNSEFQVIEGASASFSIQPRLYFYASNFSWGKSNQYFWMCKAVENHSQALCEAVGIVVKELWTELNFSAKYFLCNFSTEFIIRIIHIF